MGEGRGGAALADVFTAALRESSSVPSFQRIAVLDPRWRRDLLLSAEGRQRSIERAGALILAIVTSFSSRCI